MKLLLTSISTLLALIGYAYYFRDIFRGKTKPHVFSWFVWGVLTTIAFVAQVVDGGGIGTAVTAVSALFCFVVTAFAIRTGERSFPLSDWLALFSAGVALVLWWITDDPLLSVILITITDAAAFLPTFRKSYHKPYEETLIEYFLAGIKFVFAIPALEVLTLTTWLYPASLLVMNLTFVGLLIVRRAQLSTSAVE